MLPRILGLRAKIRQTRFPETDFFWRFAKKKKSATSSAVFATSYASPGTQNHVHWNPLGNLPCTEDFDFDEKMNQKINKNYQDSSDWENTTSSGKYYIHVNPPEIEQKFTIKNWLDSAINSKNPHENEPAYYMLSTLLQCWSLDDIQSVPTNKGNSVHR